MACNDPDNVFLNPMYATPPRTLTLDTPLPEVFERRWNAKTFRELMVWSIDREMLGCLADAGFDVSRLPEVPRRRLCESNYDPNWSR